MEMTFRFFISPFKLSWSTKSSRVGVRLRFFQNSASVLSYRPFSGRPANLVHDCFEQLNLSNGLHCETT